MRMRMIVMMVAALLMAVSTSYAEPKGWKFEVTPYAWLAGVEGEATVGEHNVEFDKSFGDLFKAVEVGGSLLATVQYNRVVGWGQVDYFKMSTDQLDVDDQPERGSLDTKTLLAEGGIGYQIDGWMAGQTFDLLIGVRSLHIENDLSLNDGRSASRDKTIVDPILVVRSSTPVLPSKINGLRFVPTIAIGGGGDSELVYELQPAFHYQVSKNVDLRLGYRRVGWKFTGDRNNDNELKIALAGMIAGVSIRF